jgi:hypothetical protein
MKNIGIGDHHYRSGLKWFHIACYNEPKRQTKPVRRARKAPEKA